eukprot:TRINITY_DN15807_c0_g1_i3.p1 TRINITY_DN15807_c0_g1~~TRINITY_DN15807_c0_g1_i3.p1  ORF type:complete len:359 (-),score=72.13 TRINITY_DN15807_c0_g1_i3:136-1167(-)
MCIRDRAYTYWVVQKYIEKPLLYKRRKFDIRVWALITSNNELFYYRQGYLRTSSEEYTLDTKQNYVHLTNNCLQQHGKKYSLHEVGNTISFEIFQNYLNEVYAGLGVDVERHLVGRMKDLMIDSFLSVREFLNPRKRKNSFELLGFDFLIDEDFRVWLIEVNINPYLGIPNKFIEGLLPKMLNDMCELVLDSHFKPVNEIPKWDIKSQFELLYSSKQKVNQRREFGCGLYPLKKMDIAPKQNEPFDANPSKEPIIKIKEEIQAKQKNSIINPRIIATVEKVLKAEPLFKRQRKEILQAIEEREHKRLLERSSVLLKPGILPRGGAKYKRNASVDPKKYLSRKY